jgi:hypothetical protein
VSKANNNSSVGGLVGWNNGEITDSYAAGRVSSFRNINVGGLAGNNYDGNSTVKNCVFDIQGTGQTDAVKGNVDNVYNVAGAPTSHDIWWTDTEKFPAERWVVGTGHYPQLNVFANAETAAAREASALSAVPVFLTSWDSSGKDTASDVTGVFLIPKWTPPVLGEEIGLKWTVAPKDALRYAESGDFWEISAARAGEAELTAETPNAKKRFKLNITQAFGNDGDDFPTAIPERRPDPVLPVDRLDDAETSFNEEHENKGVQIEFPKYELSDPQGVGQQLGEKSSVLVGNSDVERVSLTLTDGAGFAGGAGLTALGGGCGAAIEISLGSAAEEGEIDLFPVQLIFVLSSSDLEKAGLDAARIAGNAEAFLEKAVVVKLPAEGFDRTPLQLNALLRDVLIVNRDESPENPGGVRILLPYLLADAPGAPELVRDGQETRLVLFDGLKNACLRDPIWLYRAAEETGKPEDPKKPGKPEEPGKPEKPGIPEEPEKPEEPKEPEKPEEPESEEPGAPALIVFPARLSLPENESREVTAFVSGNVSGWGAARGAVWRVDDETIASITPMEKAAEEGDLAVWAVTGLKAGYTKMTASVRILADDTVLLGASLGVTVTGGRESEIAEPRQGGCNALETGAAGMNAVALVLALASGILRRRQK